MSELCICGHPRRVHERLSDLYPAICSHVDPRSIDREPEPYEGVCLCLDFEAESVAAASGVRSDTEGGGS